MTSKVFLALDPGAGNLKLVGSIDGREIKFLFRSQVYPCNREQFQVDDAATPADVVEYVQGSSKQWAGKCWISGTSVTARKVDVELASDNASLKTANILPSLLWGLTVGHEGGGGRSALKPGESNVILYVSSHNPSALAGVIREAVEGCHEVKVAGKTYRIQIVIPSEGGVVVEGSCVSHEGKNFATWDCGELTCLLTKRDFIGRPLSEPVPSDVGVGALVRLIANSKDFRAQVTGGLQGDSNVIVRGLIEAATRKPDSPLKSKIFYRANGKATDISAIYRQCFKEWIGPAINPAMNSLAENDGLEYTVIAIGGGVNLPGLAKFLQKRGIDVWEGDPLFANVESIFQQRVAPFLTEGSAQEFKFPPFAQSLKGFAPKAA